MKEYSSLSLLKVLLLVSGTLLVAATWYLVRESFRQELPPEITATKQLAGSRGEPLSLSLTGKNFSASDMTAILTPNIDNNQAAVASLPLSGNFNDALLRGNYLYLGSNDQGLYVVDASDPEQPRLRGQYLAGEVIADLLLVDDVLVVSCGQSGLFFYEIQPEGQLLRIGKLPLQQVATKCCYADGILFIATGSDGITIVDVSSFKRPILKGRKAAGFVIDLAMVNEHLIALSKESDVLTSYTIGKQGMLKVVDQYVLAGRIKGSVFTDSQIYVATTQGLGNFSLTDAGVIKQKVFFANLTTVEKLFTGKNGLYIFTSFSALIYFDPVLQQITTTFFLADKIRTLVAADRYLWVAGQDSGLTVFNAESLAANTVVDLYPIASPVKDLHIGEGKIYFALGKDGLSYLDRGDHGYELKMLSNLITSSFAVKRDYLFVAHRQQGIEVFNVGGQFPVQIAFWPQLKATQLVLWKDFVITSQGISGLKCFDISDFTQPVATDLLMNIHALALRVVDGILYVATKDQGLLIYSISEQGQLNKLAGLVPPFPMSQFAITMDVQVASGYAYIAAGRSGLLIADIKNPNRPQILSSLGLPGDSKGVLLDGRLAMVFNGKSGISLVDISDPVKPVLVGKITSPGLSRHPKKVDDLLYLPRLSSSVLAVAAPVIADTVVEADDKALLRFDNLSKAGRYDLNLSNRSGMVVIKNAVVVKN